jgi:16S rRNA (uracil1498-N3)-methyltransferase
LDHTVEAGDTFRLPEDEARHVLTVLRGRKGDAIEVVDADGHLFLAEMGGGEEASVLETLKVSGEEDIELVLYQAVPKGGRMDLVVEKTTEVGATRIVPLLTGRGLVRPRDAKVGRWRRVAAAAARQSLRLAVPEVAEPMEFSEAVGVAGTDGVLLHNAPDLEPLEAVISTPASLFVGPEGGWSEEELRVAEETGLALAQLGPYRLRSETAGMVAAARARAALERSVRRLW